MSGDIKERPPKPDALPGEIKYRPPMGGKQGPSGLEIAARKAKPPAPLAERYQDKS